VIIFERIKLTDRREGGVITTAAVMTMTSGTSESKPITRGAWISTVIFNNPPKPPPADIPEIKKDKVSLAKLTIRERFAEHRTREDCAACHTKLDPLGFALENFNPIGEWRDTYKNGRKIDTSGVLFRKHKFNNIIEFKDAILIEKERFLFGFASHLMAFALGREVSPADRLALDTIVKNAVAADYKMKPLIKEIVFSSSFMTKRNPKGAPKK
jgi:hypothetical protein